MGKISDSRNAAYNEGCEARLRGEPYRSCPHTRITRLGVLWREGWRDVELEYGKDARELNRQAGWEKWPIAPLPAVGG